MKNFFSSVTSLGELLFFLGFSVFLFLIWGGFFGSVVVVSFF